MIDTLSKQPLRSTAVAVGYFDGVHLGHRAVIQEATAARGDGAAAVFSFYPDGVCPEKKRGMARLTTLGQKAEKLEKMGVDLLICPPFSSIMGLSCDEFARMLAEDLGAHTVCCGWDYRFGRGGAGTPDDLRRLLSPYKVEVRIVDAVIEGGETVSSTRIRELLKCGMAAEAAKLLGEPFCLETQIVHGNSLGKKLGFPTANQRFDEDFLVPRYGVYAARATVDGVCYPAVTNVGVKPTVGENTPGAESFLLGFSGDLYGKTVKTQFLSYLREEKKFDSLEELSAQIMRDCDEAREILG